MRLRISIGQSLLDRRSPSTAQSPLAVVLLKSFINSCIEPIK
ncbi:hypothetical protein [Anabaena sp. CCY 9910]